MKKAILFLLLLYSVSFSQVYMNIKNKDGTTQTYKIEDVRKLTFQGVVGVRESKLLSNTFSSFTLLQNYPNPFNPSTTIEYEIPKSGNVKANIFDITGRLVKTLEDKFQKSGRYKITWNSKNNFNKQVASGIYIVNIKFNDKILSKKLMLIK